MRPVARDFPVKLFWHSGNNCMMRGAKELAVKDAENGDGSPASGAHEPGKPQKSGQKRRRWRSKKKRTATGDTGGVAISPGPGNPESAQKYAPDGAVAATGSDGCAAVTAHNCDTDQQPQEGGRFGSAKKSRRKRRRRRSKDSPVTDNPEIALNQQLLDKQPTSDQRHRRQPMSRRAPASYKSPNNQHGKNSAENSSRQPNMQKNRPQGGPHSAAYHKKPRTYYAALDLGTNNCRLLVAVPQAQGRFRVVDAFSRKPQVP